VVQGFTIDEAAAIRGLEPAAIIRHLTWMVRRGHPLAVDAFLPPEVASAWDSWRAAHGDEAPPSEPADALPLWPLFLACRTHRS
jgi:ATP-dependent DNA helicase RecQ